MESMNAVWLENRILKFRPVPIPEPLSGEALVRVRAAGICSTDLELVKGYYPFTGVLGHEFVGEIVRSPDQPDREGERVVGEINAACGCCRTCLAGRPRHCENRTVLGIVNRNGAFADYLCLPNKNLFPVPESIRDDAAVFVEPLAAALEIREQVNILPSDRVLVLGAGRLGQLIAQTLALTGCRLLVVARHEKQKKLLEAHQISWIEEKNIPAHRFDIIIEATGSAVGFDLARRAVRPAGTIVMKSTYKGEIRVDFSSIVVDEITLVGSRCGPFQPALRLLENGRIDPSGLIEKRYFFKDAAEALEHAAQSGILKIIFQTKG
jgi:2-desacetyl-2-hydroxyethyl bacteriochlorophyllide A dehydrogenase